LEAQKAMCKHTVRSQVHLLQSVPSVFRQFEIRVELQSEYWRHRRLCVGAR
jgi:hypothetical protein